MAFPINIGVDPVLLFLLGFKLVVLLHLSLRHSSSLQHATLPATEFARHGRLDPQHG